MKWISVWAWIFQNLWCIQILQQWEFFPPLSKQTTSFAMPFKVLFWFIATPPHWRHVIYGMSSLFFRRLEFGGIWGTCTFQVWSIFLSQACHGVFSTRQCVGVSCGHTQVVHTQGDGTQPSSPHKTVDRRLALKGPGWISTLNVNRENIELCTLSPI